MPKAVERGGYSPIPRRDTRAGEYILSEKIKQGKNHLKLLRIMNNISIILNVLNEEIIFNLIENRKEFKYSIQRMIL